MQVTGAEFAVAAEVVQQLAHAQQLAFGDGVQRSCRAWGGLQTLVDPSASSAADQRSCVQQSWQSLRPSLRW